MRLIILTLACKGLLISVTCALQLWSKKKRGVRDDIKYTRTNLKIVRLGITRTHGWVELAPTAPTSSSHRSSTVHVAYHHLSANDLFSMSSIERKTYSLIEHRLSVHPDTHLYNYFVMGLPIVNTSPGQAISACVHHKILNK